MPLLAIRVLGKFSSDYLKRDLRMNSSSKSFSQVALICVFAVAAFFVISGYGARFFGYLPFLLLLACPLVHLFMHNGHTSQGPGPDAHAHRDPTLIEDQKALPRHKLSPSDS